MQIFTKVNRLPTLQLYPFEKYIKALVRISFFANQVIVYLKLETVIYEQFNKFLLLLAKVLIYRHYATCTTPQMCQHFVMLNSFIHVKHYNAKPKHKFQL